MDKIDIRIMKLNKWYVPKSVKLDTLDEPVALGYFDALEVLGLEEAREKQVKQNELHPFTAGYQEIATLKMKQKEDVVDFTSQEQMLFLNISDSKEADGTVFTEAEVEEFWNDKGESSPYRYLSMIHIGQNDKLPQTLRRIRKVFKENYLSYISFDFCDIVLFAQNMTIQTFLTKIKQLFEIDEKGDIPVFDTFSMVSFWPSYTKKIAEPKELDRKDEEDEFQATINISVRNHQKFESWYQQEIQREPSESVYYDIYGRHDVSIVNNEAHTPWLMKLMKELHDEKNQDMFWTFETFIKVKHDDKIDMVSADSRNIEKLYGKVQSKLHQEIEAFRAVINRTDIRGKDRYILPLYEVRDCICSIVKNNFAEEFICCVYESFLHFVFYMKSEIEKLNNKEKGYPNVNEHTKWEKEIAKCYDKYFVAMTTLVNSVMHNERHFVQTTAFSAVFYFVPPKIMAFYNAYIYRIKQILRDESCINQYTFLIYPSFSTTISLEQISLLDTPPCDRILTVTVSEKSLYDIESVMYQMVHELAHYVGSDLRCREMRTRRIIRSLLKWIVSKCDIEDEIYQMLQNFFDNNLDVLCIGEDIGRRIEVQEWSYLQYLFAIGEKLRKVLTKPEIYEKIFMKYYQKKVESDEDFRDELLGNFGMKKESQKAYVTYYTNQYVDVNYNFFKQHLRELNKVSSQREYNRYMAVIKSVYRECYADLQMILVLAMNAEDYLSTFLINQEMNVEDILCSTEDMIRIATIFRVMSDSTLWDLPAKQDDENEKAVFAFINEYNKKIEKYIGEMKTLKSCQKADSLLSLVKKFDFKNGIKLRKCLTKEDIDSIIKKAQTAKNEPLVDIVEELYEYLLEVLEKSLKEYIKEDKIEKIRQVRTRIGTILDFNDVTKMFSCIEEELHIYKQKGCGIEPD